MGLEDYCLSLFSEYSSNNELIVSLSVLIVVIAIYLYLQRPINLVRDCTSNDPHLTQLNSNSAYPNGWIGVCESFSLGDHEIKRVDFCGNRIILLRSSSTKKPHALDAYCPHLGADLSVGGKILNQCDYDCIRCPFHGWSFRVSDGQCLDVPYTKDRKPPNGVKIKVWECHEVNGTIYVWFHTEGLKPTWTLPEIKEITSKQWKFMGRTEHTLNCLLQEIPENGPDFAHLNEVHAPSFLWGNKLREKSNFIYDSLIHQWQSDWRKGESENGHKAFLNVKIATYFLGFKLFEVQINSAEQIGPSIVHLFFNFEAVGLKYQGVYIQNVIPLGMHKQRIVQHLYVKPKFTTSLVSQFFLRGEALMLERDIQIWSNKIYLKNPRLVKEEKQIQIFRRWYSQFFSKPTAKFEDLW